MHFLSIIFITNKIELIMSDFPYSLTISIYPTRLFVGLSVRVRFWTTVKTYLVFRVSFFRKWEGRGSVTIIWVPKSPVLYGYNHAASYSKLSYAGQLHYELPSRVQFSFFSYAFIALYVFIYHLFNAFFFFYVFGVFIESTDTFILAWAQHRSWRGTFFLPS